MRGERGERLGSAVEAGHGSTCSRTKPAARSEQCMRPAMEFDSIRLAVFTAEKGQGRARLTIGTRRERGPCKVRGRCWRDGHVRVSGRCAGWRRKFARSPERGAECVALSAMCFRSPKESPPSPSPPPRSPHRVMCRPFAGQAGQELRSRGEGRPEGGAAAPRRRVG